MTYLYWVSPPTSHLAAKLNLSQHKRGKLSYTYCLSAYFQLFLFLSFEFVLIKDPRTLLCIARYAYLCFQFCPWNPQKVTDKFKLEEPVRMKWKRIFGLMCVKIFSKNNVSKPAKKSKRMWDCKQLIHAHRPPSVSLLCISAVGVKWREWKS